MRDENSTAPDQLILRGKCGQGVLLRLYGHPRTGDDSLTKVAPGKFSTEAFTKIMTGSATAKFRKICFREMLYFIYSYAVAGACQECFRKPLSSVLPRSAPDVVPYTGRVSSHEYADSIPCVRGSVAWDACSTVPYAGIPPDSGKTWAFSATNPRMPRIRL